MACRALNGSSAASANIPLSPKKTDVPAAKVLFPAAAVAEIADSSRVKDPGFEHPARMSPSLHEDPLARQYTLEGLADASDDDADLDMSQVHDEDPGYLVKLPKSIMDKLLEQLAEADDDEPIELGQIFLPIPGKHPKAATTAPKVKLYDEDIHRDYNLLMAEDEMAKNTYVFTEQDHTKYVGLEDKVLSQPYITPKVMRVLDHNHEWKKQHAQVFSSKQQAQKPLGSGTTYVKSEQAQELPAAGTIPFGSKNGNTDDRQHGNGSKREVIPKRTALVKRIRKVYNMTPVTNNSYHAHLAASFKKSNFTQAKTKYVDNPEELEADSSRPLMMGSSGNSFEEFVKPTGGKLPKGVRKDLQVRLPRQELINHLMDSFSKWPYLGTKTLNEKVKQPDMWLKEVLEDIAVYHDRGPFYGKWCLKDSYRMLLRTHEGEAAKQVGMGETFMDEGDEEEDDVTVELAMFDAANGVHNE